MSTTGTKHITLAEVIFAATVIAIAAVTFIFLIKGKDLDSHRRNSCVSNIRQIDGGKDQYALEYGGTNGQLITWYNCSLFVKDISNKCICPSSRGKITNIPNDCYSIEPLGLNPRCRIAKPDMGHTIPNR